MTVFYPDTKGLRLKCRGTFVDGTRAGVEMIEKKKAYLGSSDDRTCCFTPQRLCQGSWRMAIDDPD